MESGAFSEEEAREYLIKYHKSLRRKLIVVLISSVLFVCLLVPMFGMTFARKAFLREHLIPVLLIYSFIFLLFQCSVMCYVKTLASVSAVKKGYPERYARYMLRLRRERPGPQERAGRKEKDPWE